MLSQTSVRSWGPNAVTDGTSGSDKPLVFHVFSGLESKNGEPLLAIGIELDREFSGHFCSALLAELGSFVVLLATTGALGFAGRHLSATFRTKLLTFVDAGATGRAFRLCRDGSTALGTELTLHARTALGTGGG